MKKKTTKTTKSRASLYPTTEAWTPPSREQIRQGRMRMYGQTARAVGKLTLRRAQMIATELYLKGRDR